MVLCCVFDLLLCSTAILWVCVCFLSLGQRCVCALTYCHLPTDFLTPAAMSRVWLHISWCVCARDICCLGARRARICNISRQSILEYSSSFHNVCLFSLFSSSAVQKHRECGVMNSRDSPATEHRSHGIPYKQRVFSFCVRARAITARIASVRPLHKTEYRLLDIFARVPIIAQKYKYISVVRFGSHKLKQMNCSNEKEKARAHAQTRPKHGEIVAEVDARCVRLATYL